MTKFTCIFCNKKYSRRESMVYHLTKSKSECRKKYYENGTEQLLRTSVGNFDCSVCGKAYKNKSSLNRHLRQKHPSISKSTILVQNCSETTPKSNGSEQHLTEKSYPCPLCNMQFSRKSNMKRHLDRGRCDSLPQKGNTINNKNDNYNFMGGTGNVTNDYSNNINNSNQVNNNNMILMNYGKEGLANMPDRLYNHCFGKGLDAVKELTRLINFNDKHPERQNMSLNNIYSSFIDVFIDDMWQKADRDTFINDLYKDRANLLIEKYNHLCEIEEVTDNRQTKFNRFVDTFTNDEGTFEKKQCRELQLLIHNNSSKVKKSKAKRKKAVIAIDL